MIKIFVFILSLAFACSSAAQTEDPVTLTNELKKATTAKKKFNLVYRICEYYLFRGINDSVQLRSKDLLEIAQAEKQDTFFIASYNLIGNYFNNTGNYSLALQYYFRALNLAEKNDDVRNRGLLNSNIGWSYILLENYENGIVFCKKAVIDMGQTKKSSIMLVSAYDNLAIAYIELKQADSALHYTQLANSENLKAQNEFEQSFIYYEFARTYQLLNDLDMAEVYYKKSILHSKAKMYQEGLSVATAHFCRMLLEQKRYGEAKQYGIDGLNAAYSGGYKRLLIDNAEVLSATYDELKQTDSAYHYSKMVNAYTDSVFNQQKIFEIQNIIFSQQLYEREQAEEKQLAHEKRRQNLQYAAIAIGLITFIIVFLLLSRSVVVNEKFIKYFGILGLLAVFEFINLYIHPYLASATNHSVVLLLVALIIVSALLIPLHHKLEKWITRIMVEKNKKIRLAAAKKTIAKLETEPTN